MDTSTVLRVLIVMVVMAVTVSATCTKEGKTYEIGENVPSSEVCTICVCTSDGSVSCNDTLCPELQCDEHLWTYEEGACCPSCLSNRRRRHAHSSSASSSAAEGCYHPETDKTYFYGGFTFGEGCKKRHCVCQFNGAIKCGEREPCPTLECNPAAAKKVGDDCCPTCIGCVINGTVVKIGEKIKVDACETCECVGDGQMTNPMCWSQVCSQCNEGYVPLPKLGQCCPTCVPQKPVVVDIKPACARRCPKLYCPFFQQLLHPHIDKCCRVCRCFHDNKVHLPGPFGNRCNRCECDGQNGKATCIKPVCIKPNCDNPVWDQKSCCNVCPTKKK